MSQLPAPGFVRFACTALLLFTIGAVLTPTFAEGFPAESQASIDSALSKLSGWAANPDVLAAVKAANASPDGAMNNGKWVELGDASPEVTAITSTDISKQLGSWQQEGGLNKLYLRAANGDLVAGPDKPLVYNVAKRPPFVNASAGKVWHAPKAKPDPTTQQKSVQISVPVKDGDAVIGVLHSSVIVP